MSNYVKLATDAGDQYLSLARRDPRELLEGHDGVRRAFRAHDPDRAAAGFGRAADGAGSHGGVVRLHAKAAETAEELQREAVVGQRAGREVIALK